MEPIYKEAALPITKIHKTTLFKTPPWKIITPKTDLNLCKYNKKATHPITFQENFLKIQEKYPNYIHIFTDGSKQNNATTSAAIINRKIQIKKHLPRETSIFSTEVYAINLALDQITKSRDPKYIIFSGSQSAIVAIEKKKLNNPLIAKLLAKLNNISNQKETIFCWIPSHIGIQGNEMMDSAAKTAQNNPLDTHFKIPFTDLKRTINIYTKQKWQNYWDNFQNNKLYEIMLQIGKSQKNQTKMSRKEVTLSRLRIGHSHITHSYLLKKEALYCIPCQKPYTIKHILTECII